MSKSILPMICRILVITFYVQVYFTNDLSYFSDNVLCLKVNFTNDLSYLSDNFVCLNVNFTNDLSYFSDNNLCLSQFYQ